MGAVVLASLKLVEKFLTLPQINVTCATGLRTFERKAFDLSIIAPLLTRQGFEVDAITERGKGFESVVVGRIEKAERHPNADKLQVCQVNVGEAQARQIVCGAKNARAGMYVAVALPGAVLPGGLEIKASAIRTVESAGMLCSRTELGLPLNLPTDGDGIWEIEHEAQGGISANELQKNIGVPVYDALGLRDTLLDLNVTPNRPDMLCHEGVAREIAVGLRYAKISFEWKGVDFSAQSTTPGIAGLMHQVLAAETVQVGDWSFSAENALGVSAFFVALDNVTVTHSPAWLRNLIEALGQSSINNIVDASNFILFTFGHPSHAFDLEKLAVAKGTKTKKLYLRMAQQGEVFAGLDGKERNLEPQDCIVADSERPQALLGVIGGELSKVDIGTKSVVLEFANPNPVAVRRTSRRHGRRTESSFAFEKGIDTASRWEAAHQIVGLMAATSPTAPRFAGAVASKSVTRAAEAKAFVPDAGLESCFGPALALGVSVDFSAVAVLKPLPQSFRSAPWLDFADALTQRYQVQYAATQLAKVLGAELVSYDAQQELLRSLGFKLDAQVGSTQVMISQTPHWRWLDIAGAADLVEEVIRIVGIDKVPSTPLISTGAVVPDDAHLAGLEQLATRAVVLGYNEIAGYHFMREDDILNLGLLSADALGEPVAMMNPIIRDEPLMHTSLVPNLLRRIARNLSYGVKRGQLFHATRTYQNLDVSGAPVFTQKGLSINQAINHTIDESKRAALGAQNALLPGALLEYSPENSYAYSREKSQAGRPAETPRLAGVVFGVREAKNWMNTQAREWLLSDVLGHVLELGRSLGVELEFDPMATTHPFAGACHPGRRAQVWTASGKEVDGRLPVGFVAALHPRTARAFDIDEPTFVFELNAATLLKAASQSQFSTQKRTVSPLKFPTVSRDFSFFLDEAITGRQLDTSVTAALGKHGLMGEQGEVPARLLEIRIFDIYKGKGVPEGQKSVAFNVTLEPLGRTLTDADIQKISQKVMAALKSDLGGEMRG